MNNPDAVATQQMMCGLSDNPDQWRRAPFVDLYGACLAAKLDDDDERCPEDGPF
jgi:hypothetical protein